MSYRSLKKLCQHYYHETHRAQAIRRHGEILTLSSGINHLPAPAVLKESIGREFSEDRFYTSYTDHCGSKLFLSTVYYELRELTKDRGPRIHPGKNISRTIGGTGALSSVIGYLGSSGWVKKALVLGLNYSLFTLWYEKYGIAYRTVKSRDESRILPTVEEALAAVSEYAPDMIILTQPTNPSGEAYTAHELRVLVNEAIKRDIWFLLDDVPNLYNVQDTLLPNVFEVVEQGEYPEKLIYVNSFSKSRSMAGLRFGYAVTNEEIRNNLYRLNDELYWSPQHVASCALSKDVLFRLISKRVKGLDEASKERTMGRMLRQYAHLLQVMSPYADDMSRFEDNFAYVKGERSSLLEEFKHYEKQLEGIYRAYSGNWARAVSVLGPYMKRSIPSVHGFNHCFLVDAKVGEGDFCVGVFEDTGIDFYTQAVFDDHDDLSRGQFFVRMSCALNPVLFDAGLARLEGVFGKYCRRTAQA